MNRRFNDFIIYAQNSRTFGSYNLRCLRPHIWNTLPENIKEITSFERVKESVKN